MTGNTWEYLVMGHGGHYFCYFLGMDYRHRPLLLSLWLNHSHRGVLELPGNTGLGATRTTHHSTSRHLVFAGSPWPGADRCSGGIWWWWVLLFSDSWLVVGTAGMVIEISRYGMVIKISNNLVGTNYSKYGCRKLKLSLIKQFLVKRQKILVN